MNNASTKSTVSQVTHHGVPGLRLEITQTSMDPGILGMVKRITLTVCLDDAAEMRYDMEVDGRNWGEDMRQQMACQGLSYVEAWDRRAIRRHVAKLGALSPYAD